MSLLKLAWINFKGSIRSWLMMIVSLSFSLMVMINIFNIIFSDMLSTTSEYTQKMVNSVMLAVIVILAIFLIFYIAYATTVFFRKQKKELGMYVFMGFSMQKIAALCLIEILMIGLTSLIIGFVGGLLFCKLFGMLIETLSGVPISSSFMISSEAMVYGCLMFWLIYLFFSFVKFIGICRSSVIDLLNANRTSERKAFRPIWMVFRAIFGIGFMGYGCYLAIRPSNNLFEQLVPIVLLICFGIYLLFSGFIPLVLSMLQKNKHFLYQEQRNLWINSLIFRMTQNYMTYTVTAILLISSLTALATGLALQQRKQKMDHAAALYPIQILSQSAVNQDFVDSLIHSVNPDAKITTIPMKMIPTEYGGTELVLSLNGFERLLEISDNENPLKDQPLDDTHYLDLEHLYLMSFRTEESAEKITIADHSLDYMGKSDVPVLGSLALASGAVIVSDSVFDSMPEDSLRMSMEIVQNIDQTQANQIAQELAAYDPSLSIMLAQDKAGEMNFVSITYAISYFVFLVFVISACSILAIRIVADAAEERGRIIILHKLGIDKSTLSKAAMKEVAIPYVLTFVLTTICSIFVIWCLNSTMNANLFHIQLIGLGAILAILAVFCVGSIMSYQKNSGLLKIYKNM